MKTESKPKTAFFLVGPTAVGKTTISQHIAENWGADIVSADSMSVYREMNIGTDKPSQEERQRVKYAGLDMVDPDRNFNLAEYLKGVRPAFRSAQQDGRDLIVAGGTGLYIKCLIDGFDRLSGSNPALRREAESILKTEGLEALRKRVSKEVPSHYDRLDDPLNPRRLVRAWEIGQSGSTQPKSWKNSSSAKLVGLCMERKLLLEQIEDRIEEMYAGGLFEEVRDLLDKYPALSKTASQAIGYAEAIAVLNSEMKLDMAKERTLIRTRRLAKRQMTWFRNQVNVDWVQVWPDSDPREVAQEVKTRWKENGQTPISY